MFMLHPLLQFSLLSLLAFGSTAFHWNREPDLFWAEHCEWSGNDLSNRKVPGELCGPACANTKKCTHFGWSAGTCWLKQGLISRNQARINANDYSVCGYMADGAGFSSEHFIPSKTVTAEIVDWREEGDLFWALNCDWPLNSFDTIKMQGEQCGPECVRTVGCTHFEWTNEDGGTCWLKKGSLDLNQATASFNATCGKLKPSGPASGVQYLSPATPTKISRSWNCCKPMCGWPDFANVSSPVQSCNASGWNAVDPAEVGSACEPRRGSAYMCNWMQPFATRDEFSFAFAALSTEPEESCCACYELTFTSRPLIGRSMVVQVIDLRSSPQQQSTFDLLIPGGGTGNLNGCTSQWGAPQYGWGERGVGVSRRDHCYELPQELQPGCFWRFDWLKNTDSPNASSRRVKCPEELVQRSKCRRLDE